MTVDPELEVGHDFIDANIGLVLDGRYLITRTLGSGGMGIVYEAQHQTLKSRHAVKILHKHHMQRAEVVRRFLNEARAAGNLGHPNIVRSTDTGKTPEGIPYVVFEYLDGVTLKEELVDCGALPLARGLDIAIQTARALECAHAAKVVHRDVKPENLFLLEAPEGGDLVKLIDFGIAKFAAATTMTSEGRVFGSPQYMSPEQLLDAGAVDERSDIFALGVLLREMLSGVSPPRGVGATAPAVVAVPEAEGAGRGTLAPALERLVTQMTARDPDARPASMAEVRASLEGLAADVAAGRLEARSPEMAPRRARPRRMAAAFAIGVFAVGAAAAWVLSRDDVATSPTSAGAGGGAHTGAPGGPRAPVATGGTAPPAGTEVAEPGADAGAEPDARATPDAPKGADVAADAPRPDDARAARAVRRAKRRTRRAPREDAPSSRGDGPPIFTAPPP